MFPVGLKLSDRRRVLGSTLGAWDEVLCLAQRRHSCVETSVRKPRGSIAQWKEHKFWSLADLAMHLGLYLCDLRQVMQPLTVQVPLLAKRE